MKAIHSAHLHLPSEEARRILRERQEGDGMPGPTLGNRTAPSSGALGGPSEGTPSLCSPPGYAFALRTSLFLSALVHPLDPPALASYVNLRLEDGSIARPLHPSGNRVYVNVRHGDLCVGGESLQDLVKFGPDREAHVLQPIGSWVSRGLSKPVLNFTPPCTHQ